MYYNKWSSNVSDQNGTHCQWRQHYVCIQQCFLSFFFFLERILCIVHVSKDEENLFMLIHANENLMMVQCSEKEQKEKKQKNNGWINSSDWTFWKDKESFYECIKNLNIKLLIQFDIKWKTKQQQNTNK